MRKPDAESRSSSQNREQWRIDMTMMYPGMPAVMPPPPPPMLGPMLPRQGEPGWAVWTRKLWPIAPLPVAPHRLLGAAAVVGLIGTGLWRPSVMSVGYLVVGLMVFGVVDGTADPRAT